MSPINFGLGGIRTGGQLLDGIEPRAGHLVFRTGGDGRSGRTGGERSGAGGAGGDRCRVSVCTAPGTEQCHHCDATDPRVPHDRNIQDPCMTVFLNDGISSGGRRTEDLLGYLVADQFVTRTPGSRAAPAGDGGSPPGDEEGDHQCDHGNAGDDKTLGESVGPVLQLDDVTSRRDTRLEHHRKVGRQRQGPAVNRGVPPRIRGQSQSEDLG